MQVWLSALITRVSVMRKVLRTIGSLPAPQLTQLPSASVVSHCAEQAPAAPDGIVKPQLPSVHTRPDGPPPWSAQALSAGAPPNTLPQNAPSWVLKLARSTSEVCRPA